MTVSKLEKCSNDGRAFYRLQKRLSEYCRLSKTNEKDPEKIRWHDEIGLTGRGISIYYCHNRNDMVVAACEEDNDT